MSNRTIMEPEINEVNAILAENHIAYRVMWLEVMSDKTWKGAWTAQLDSGDRVHVWVYDPRHEKFGEGYVFYETGEFGFNTGINHPSQALAEGISNLFMEKETLVQIEIGE